MEFIDLIFSLIRRFVHMDQGQYGRLYEEANKWRHEINPDNPKDKVESFYLKAHSQWYYKLLYTVSYIPLVRWINDYMNGSDVEDEERVIN